MKTRKKMLLKIWGLLLAIFVLGGITGAAVDGLYRSRAKADSRVASMKDGDAYFQLLNRELRLSAEQGSAVAAILDETRNEYRTICAEVRPRYDHLRDRARVRMRALFDPEQQERFDSIVTRENCNCPDQGNQSVRPVEQNRN